MNATQRPGRRRKLISTSGLTLTLLLLFLPFIGVSCESGMGSVDAEISGWDMAVGGAPSVSRTGLFSLGGPADLDSIPVQGFMVLAVVAILGAILFGIVLPTAFARALGAGIASAFAALFVIINQVKVNDDLIQQAGNEGTPEEVAADWISSRMGFWLTLSVLLLMTGYFLISEVTASRRAGDQAIRPGGSYPPPYSGPVPPPS
ncbi:MAG: hypothetical protein ACRDTC_20190 [Pseudonocardiaceae bacterium]